MLGSTPVLGSGQPGTLMGAEVELLYTRNTLNRAFCGMSSVWHAQNNFCCRVGSEQLDQSMDMAAMESIWMERYTGRDPCLVRCKSRSRETLERACFEIARLDLRHTCNSLFWDCL